MTALPLNPGPLGIRSFQPGDRAAVLALVPRFGAVPLPPWRGPEEVERYTREGLAPVLAGDAPGAALLVAESPEGGLLGFIHLQAQADAFTGEAVGYVSELAVAPEAEGRGIGRALLDAGEAWSRAQGHRRIGLHVFAGNIAAQALYRRAGFEPEVLTWVKPLEADEPQD